MTFTHAKRGAVAVLVLAAGQAASGQTFNWAAAVSDNWNDPFHWTPSGVPTTPGTSAVLGFATPYTVTLDVTASIDELHINNDMATLNISAARLLTLNGVASTNAGIININPENSSSNAHLIISGSTVLSGPTGIINLLANGNDSQISGTGTLTNGAGHVIQGTGQVLVDLVNESVVRADTAVALAGTQMLLSNNMVTNNDTMVAETGSSMQFTGVQVTQAPGGVILGNDGAIGFSNASVSGGMLNTNGAGVVAVNGGTTTLESVTNDGLLQVNAGTIASMTGVGLTNDGLIQLNPQNSSSNASFLCATSGLLGGTGVLQLLANGNDSQIIASAGQTLTNGVNHTIEGTGQITAPVINNGRIIADISVALSGGGMTLFTSNKTNNGEMNAEPGSTLAVSGITIDQSGGGQFNIEGTLTTANVTILDGPINAVGAGSYFATAATTLQDVTLNTPTTVNAGVVLNVAGAGLTNNGVMQLNPTASSSDAFLSFVSSGLLDGNGTVELNGGSNNSRITTGAGITMTVASTQTIEGTGQVEASLVNNGRISADESIGAAANLSLMTNPKTNNALLTAEAASTLTVTGIAIDQAGGGQIVANDGTVILTNATILDGQIDSTGAGSVNCTGSSTMTDVELNAPSLVQTGIALTVTGAGLTHNNIMTLNPTNGASDAFLLYGTSGVLEGTGEVRMVSGGNNSRVSTAAGQVLTHASPHVIRGVGQIDAALINDSVIQADASIALSGTDLRLQSNGKTNNSMITSELGSSLTVAGIQIDQTGGGSLEANDGLIVLSNATIVDGQINGSGAGMAVVSASSTMTDVTLNCPSEVNTGIALTVSGTSGLEHNSVMRLNPTSGGSNAFLIFGQSGPLTGTGEVQLVSGGNNAQIATSPGATITHDSNHSIRGVGEIHASLINNGLISADVAVAVGGGSDLRLASSTKINNSAIRAEAGSSLTVSGITVDQNGGGTLTADMGTLLFSNCTIDGGLIQGVGGGTGSLTANSTFSGVTSSLPTSVPTGLALTISGGMTNNSLLDLNPTNGGSDAFIVVADNTPIQGSGEIRLTGALNNAQLTVSAGVTGTTGAGMTISGIGSVRGPWIFDGRIAPGLSVGSLFMDNAKTFTGTSVYEVEIDPNTMTADSITGTGSFSLAGTVNVVHLAPYTPTIGDSYTILTGNAVSGTFDYITSPIPPAGTEWALTYSPTQVTLELVAGCLADFNEDTFVNTADFIAFLNAFVAQSPSTDFAAPFGVINTADFIAFLNIFNTPC